MSGVIHWDCFYSGEFDQGNPSLNSRPHAMDTAPGDTLPSCKGCTHYYITHDVSFRYGCRALNFKSQRQPVLDVIAASGQPCLYFSRKPEQK